MCQYTHVLWLNSKIVIDRIAGIRCFKTTPLEISYLPKSKKQKEWKENPKPSTSNWLVLYRPLLSKENLVPADQPFSMSHPLLCPTLRQQPFHSQLGWDHCFSSQIWERSCGTISLGVKVPNTNYHALKNRISRFKWLNGFAFYVRTTVSPSIGKVMGEKVVLTLWQVWVVLTYACRRHTDILISFALESLPAVGLPDHGSCGSSIFNY